MWKLAGVCLIAGLIAGCGGGGGGGSSSNNSPNAGPTSAQVLTLSGSVVMGPVSNATVEAFCHAVTPAASIGSGRSDDQAHYSFTTSRPCPDVIELRVSGGSYVDEATGSTVTGSTTPWLHALVDGTASGTSKTAHITALTAVVYAKATAAAAKPSTANFASATQQVKTDLLVLFPSAEVDPLTTQPVVSAGTAASDPVKAYALLLAAVSKLSGPTVNGFSNFLGTLTTESLNSSSVGQAINSVKSDSAVLARISVTEDDARTLVAFMVTQPVRDATLAGGDTHTLAVSVDGVVSAWGSNGYFKLGLGIRNEATRTSPVTVPGISNVLAVATGDQHSLALRTDGTVWGWGSNYYGQLGLGSTVSDATSPIQVPGLANIATVATTGVNSFAVGKDGSVWSWGLNGSGELGDGTETDRSSPVRIAGLTDVVEVAGGGTHVLALRRDGTVWAWGYSYEGALGVGGSALSVGKKQSLTPIQVQGLSNVVSIAAGNDLSVALRSDGTVWAWGGAGNGGCSLGRGANQSSWMPAQVGQIAHIVGIKASGSFTLALRDDGTVWSWGSNRQTKSNAEAAPVIGGQLGDGTSDSQRCEPGQVSGLTSIRSIGVGPDHGLAIDTAGSLYTWGSNRDGELGNGVPGNRLAPGKLALSLGATSSSPGNGTPGVNARVIQIAAGVEHSLALGTGEVYWAWGSNYSGNLGNGSTVDQPTPIKIALAGVDSLAAGTDASMALKSDGTVLSWGYNSYGELGDGTTTGRAMPGSVAGLTGIRKLSFKYAHALALAGNGTVWAWGSNSAGELGDGSKTNRSTPVKVLGLEGGSPVVQVVAGVSNSLALRADGTVWAWGGVYNTTTNKNDYNLTAQPVIELPHVEAIAAGHIHNLALRSDGTVWVWGNGLYGQYGTGSQRNPSPIPVQVPGLSDVRAIAAGRYFSLALRGDGTVWMWGAREETSPLSDENLALARLGTLTGVRSMVASSDHAVMTTTDGSVWVWGSNKHGKLGLSGITFASTPMPLPLP
jgi:alpha-tubulin suppressor-like RCC1 family protein